MPLRRRPLDLFLAAWFAVFAFTSLVYEMFIVFRVDLREATDPIGSTWRWYAESFDPIFLDPPFYLWLMCAVDAFVFGPFHLVLVYAFVKERAWIRTPAFCYVAAIVYSTVIYFGIEVAQEAARANLAAVFCINLPYTLVPLLLAYRLRHAEPFGAPARAVP